MSIPGLIRDLEKYKQAKLLDYSGFGFERSISPTDIDFFVEIKNQEFIYGEFKFLNSDLPYGQRTAMSNMLRAMSSTKKVLGFIAHHNTPPNEVIIARNSLIIEVWTSKTGWVIQPERITVMEQIQRWRAG
jgi:hypothetical protein